jgi:hypothetical protein
MSGVYIALHWLLATQGGAVTGVVIAAVIVCIALGGGLQLAGHIVFDKSQPAFRAFEAFFTTPFYLYLYVMMHAFSYNKPLRDDIAAATKMWRGSERVLYGERPFRPEDM